MAAHGQIEPSYDCIVIGAGHNGLVCATLLARAGRRVLVAEAGNAVGGAASTHEFAPGYRVSTAAHLLHLMPASLLGALRLSEQGLKFAGQHLPTHALGDDGQCLAATPAAVAAASARDASSYPAFLARMQRLAGALSPMLSSVPPRLGTEDWSDRLALLKLGWQIRRLGRRDMRELLRIIGMNVYDLFTDELHAPLLQGLMGFDATLGANLGPRAPGTVLTWLYRLAHEGRADTGLAQPVGGMGALAAALASAATAAGAHVRTGAPVARILVADDRAAGVVLASGQEVAARAVISSADPKTTFLDLVGTAHLDTGFVRKVVHSRSRGIVAKLHLALDRLPAFRGVPAAALAGRLVYAPDLDHLERAFDAPKYGRYAEEPVLEITVPTVNDASLAPNGHHVLSALVECAPGELRGGWAQARGPFQSLLTARLEALAPGLSTSIVAAELVTPVDLEQRLGNRGGHWHHTELAFDQFYFVRPFPGAARSRAPVPGVYLCGAGSHPGGGVAGVAGRLAAEVVVAEWR